MSEIKLAVFDFDGTFTDGQFYIGTDGTLSKSYNGKDSYGIKMLKDAGIMVGILTAHDSDYYHHLRKLNHFNKLDFFLQGSVNKIQNLSDWKNKLQINWNQILYMGDDLGDLDCIKACYSACPADAIQIIKDHSDFISKYNGGKGAVREVVEHCLEVSAM